MTVLARGILALLLVLASIVGSAAATDPLLFLEDSAFVLADAAAPPPDAAAWQPQALPDHWDASHPGASGQAWYRLHFRLPKLPAEAYAAYLSSFRTEGGVYINGVYIGQTRPFDNPFSAPPQLFTIPPSLLRVGDNDMHLRLHVREGWDGAVSAVTVGDEAQVRPQYEHDLFLRITGPQISCAFSTALGLFMLSFWLQRRQETMYGYFGLAALLSAASSTYDFVASPPLPVIGWMALNLSLDHLVPVLLVFFALRYAGWHWPRVERWLGVYAIASVVIICVEQLHFEANIHYWRFTYYPVIFLYLAILAIAARKRPPVERTLLTVAVLFQLAANGYEIVSTEFLDDPELDKYWSYHILPLYLAIAWILIDRFVRSLNAYEELNAELEQRVAAKGAELERNFQSMQQMEQARAVLDERKRLMSDMHDGVGAQLISTLSLVEHGNASTADVAGALRECIDDLRLTIDSLEPSDNDLLPALGNLRYRLDPRLKARGIDLDWRVAEVPKLTCLTPQNVLHVLRILQEAFTNVLKHAHARSVSVTTGVDASGVNVFIRLQDDGRGFVSDRVGYGLRNMRQRAKIIGGDLEIESSPTGTMLQLLLPVT